MRKAKLYRQQQAAKRAEYAAKLLAPQYPDITSPEQFLAYCEGRMGISIEIDDQNREVIMTLMSYFGGLRNQYTENLSFQKGILLYGNVGTGKTTLMDMVRESVHAPFRMVPALQIVNDYQKKNGLDLLEEYCRLGYNPSSGRYFGNQHIGLCIDDIGTENEGKNFGNQKNVVGEIIMTRYQQLRGPFTHLTTNCTVEEIKAYYGIRVFDRMREMFNIVSFPVDADSRRK